MVKLSRADWIEIYYALDMKADWVEEIQGDCEWTLSLRELMGKIGPDGENMYDSKEGG